MSSNATSNANAIVTPAPTHPPIPPANTPALPSDFSDIPQSVISCWDARASYSSASLFLYTELLKSRKYTWSSWSTTSYSYITYTDERFSCSTIVLPSLTTLCDGFPRASTTSSTCQISVGTSTVTVTGKSTYYPSWSTELDLLPSPTCTIAKDFGSICTRLSHAYRWRTSFLSQNPSITGSIAGPECTVLNDSTVPAKPPCYLDGGEWEAFYWPKAIPTGSSFCNTNGTDITATSTRPGQANTAVISGLTMTSPSVYYLLRNATLLTLAGKASSVGDAYTAIRQNVFSASTTVSLLTLEQKESEILTISRFCPGSNRDRYCTFHASPGFSVQDLATVRASEYCGTWGCGTSETIYQGNYHPTLGLPVSSIVSQNGVWSDCAWTTSGERVVTAGSAAYNGGRMKIQDWHPITAVPKDAKESLETGS